MSISWASSLLLAVQGVINSPPAPPAPPAPAIITTRIPKFPHDAVSLRSLPTLFSTADYPAAALRAGQQGTVGFTLAISNNGVVEGCTVSQKSGSTVLDETTCSLLQRRARFFPARDAKGRAIKGTATGRIKWALPQASVMPFANRSERLVYMVDAKGALGPCRLESSTDPWQSELRLCEVAKTPAVRMLRDFAPNGQANNRELVIGEGALVDGPIDALKLGRGAGEKVLVYNAMTLTLEPSGRVASCVPVPGDTQRPVTELACTRIAQQKFAALAPGTSTGAQRQITLYRISYTRPLR